MSRAPLIRAALAVGLLLTTFSPLALAESVADQGEALREAARRGDVAAVRELLTAGVDVNAANSYGATALSYAADRGQLDVVRVLVEAGADVNVKDRFYNATPVVWAGYNDHFDVVRYLLEHGVNDVDASLAMAAYSGQRELIDIVLATGKATPEGMTKALQAAQAAEKSDVAELLVKAGAKPPAPPETPPGEQTASTAPAEEPAATPPAVAKETQKESGETEKADAEQEPASRNWPGFRGDNAAGVATGQDLPTEWDATTGKNVVWKTAIPGRAHASPVIWGDRLFVVTAVSEEPEGEFRTGLYGDVDSAPSDKPFSWRVYALDKRSGEVLWQREATAGVPRVAHHIKATQASSTPVTDGKHLVAVLGSEGMFCYDFAGKLLWQRDLGLLDAGWFYDASYQWGHSSSPIIVNDRVIVQVDRHRDSYIAAYALADGRELWRTSRDNIPSWGTPTVAKAGGKLEIVTNGTPHIRAYDPADGRELWSLGPNSEISVATPVVGHGLVYLTGGYPPVRPIYAVEPGARGELKAPEGESAGSPHLAWSKDRDGTYIPTPIVYGDLFYTLANNGVITAYDAASGEQLYRERVVEKGSEAFSASPVAGDGKLYLASEDGDVHVLRAGPRLERLARNPMGEVLMATPAISEETIYVRSLDHVFAIAEAAPSSPAAGASAPESSR